jgi:hypothetical protein
MYVPKWEEVEGDWINLRNDELHGMHSPDILQVMKIMRMRWVWNVARMGGKKREMRSVFWCRILHGRVYLENESLEGRIFLYISS